MNLHLIGNFLKESKLKSKPWINREILLNMKERDKLLHKYCKSAHRHSASLQIIYDEYKVVGNQLTKMKRVSKVDYYHKYFEENKNNLSNIWKGI